MPSNGRIDDQTLVPGRGNVPGRRVFVYCSFTLIGLHYIMPVPSKRESGAGVTQRAGKPPRCDAGISDARYRRRIAQDEARITMCPEHEWRADTSLDDAGLGKGPHTRLVRADFLHSSDVVMLSQDLCVRRACV